MNTFNGYNGSGSGNTSNNARVVGEVKDMQDRMLESLNRAGQQVNEINETGKETMAQLEQQTGQLENIIETLDQQKEAMNDAEKQQDRLAFWTCNFFYKCKANKELRKQRKKKKLNKNKKDTNNDDNENDNENNNAPAPKRRGPLPGKKQTKIAAARDELFARKGERPTAHAPYFGKSKGSGPLLTKSERRGLAEIAENDRRMDEKLDELGEQTGMMLDQAMLYGHQIEKQSKLLGTAKNKMGDNEDQIEKLYKRTETFSEKKQRKKGHWRK